MLASEGLSMAVAGSGLTAYNLGGVIGALACAVAISRFGSRWPLVLCCAGAAASAFALQALNVGKDTSLLIFGFGVHGMFVNAVQSTMYALCAFMYPTSVRATGTASAILSAFAGAAVITAGGAMAYLALLGSAMFFAMVALLIVRRHIPKREVLLPGRETAHV
jgi:AAHS family 4-hydroxybenzoate transporter-like MFS transporter